tara:strand:- start:1117 stop:1539 length:423 start_codon:yes stop_codon:yes gene_type:complete
MTKKFKILAEFVKDISSETPDIQSYIFVKENISKYHLNIDITSKALKDKMIEVNTTLKFQDKELNEKRSHFEIVYATIVRIDGDVEDKKDLERIVLRDVQNDIYPNLEKTFLDLIHNSGFPEVSLDKKVDFNKLYDERFN